MDLSPEIIESNKFTPEQVAVVKSFGESYIADQKKAWDGKANENAEGILSGVVTSLQSKTGVKLDRDKGEKYADYLSRISDKFLEGKSTELAAAKADYEAKLKDFKGGDLLKEDLDKAKKSYDDLLQKTADYEDIKAKAEKYEPLTQEYQKLKLDVAFQGVKPNFPEAINAYEAKAKWGEFVASVLAKYDIEFADNKPVAIDKENKYKVVPLSELVKADETITALAAGRHQSGPNAKPGTNTVTVEGVPFPVPENCTTQERAKLIQEQLAKEGINSASDQYAKKFAEYNNKILNRGK